MTAENFKCLPLDVFRIDDIFIVADCTLADCLFTIRNQFINIHFFCKTKSLAVFTCPKWCIEGKQTRFKIGNGKSAFRTGIAGREHRFLFAV